MDRDDIIARLRENKAALREHGVMHAALFGSHAREDAREDSENSGAVRTCLSVYFAHVR